MTAPAEHVGLELALAIRAGDLRQISELLDAHPGLAAKPIAVLRSRTPLMVVGGLARLLPERAAGRTAARGRRRGSQCDGPAQGAR